MDKCFADRVLLSNLILDRTDSKILFITNDRMLSRDANEINYQASCRGHKIDTCYISDSGALKPGYKVKKDEPLVERVEVIKYIAVPTEDDSPSQLNLNENRDPSVLSTIGKYTFAVVSGFLIGAYGKSLIRCVKNKGGKANVKRDFEQCC